MNRRSALWLLGGVVLALMVVLTVLDLRMQDAGGPRIIGFEFAGSQDRAHEILADWGQKGHDAARLSLWIDYPYLIAYGAFLALAVAGVRDGARSRGWSRLAWAGGAVVVLAVLTAAFDASEDVFLLLSLGGHGGKAAPVLGTVFATAKFACLAAVLAYLGAALVTRLRT